MSFTRENVVPWGRSFDECVSMFALSNADLKKHIVVCSDGPAAFNVVYTRQGRQVFSVDPLYRFLAEDIQIRISETYADVMEQMRKNQVGLGQTLFCENIR